MFQSDVANRLCRPTCERFFASLDGEIGGAERQDQTTLRLCRALLTRADEMAATYDELFAGAACAMLDIAYATGHGADDILAMLGPKLDELSTPRVPVTPLVHVHEASLLGRKSGKSDPRVQSLLKALFGETKPGSSASFDALLAAANTLLLVVRDTGMSAQATREAVRRIANASYAS